MSVIINDAAVKSKNVYDNILKYMYFKLLYIITTELPNKIHSFKLLQTVDNKSHFFIPLSKLDFFKLFS